ncbi:MAG: hypothetical protein F6K37_34660 [Moorea sp. SIO4E2]|uniref:hypothetical protein n=1 Tax=Moorena sp. SIO4E2 TaxID=2607826 RepID=UPI0013B778EB|nr:hypothetical protein [Moorena sp. SIO4E2]NEQ10875.1 hypothetical protein [Moorena sp. SIO4E2]
MKIKLIIASMIISALSFGVLGVHAQISSGGADPGPGTAQNESGSEQNPLLTTSVQEADFIFRGTVEKIQYRLSSNQRGLPHTFVTYKVEETLKGRVKPGSLVTLRFIGGHDNKGNFLTVSGVSFFDVGDTDILLVKGNGKSGCPLVGCAEGRIRVINNQAFSDEGQPILLTSQEQLVYGKHRPLKEVVTHRIGDTVIETVLSTPTGKNQDGSSESGVVESANVQVFEQPLERTKLEGLIKTKLNQLSRAGQVQRRQFTTTVDPDKNFVVKLGSPSAPPQTTVSPGFENSILSSTADRREMEMLMKNEGNPVLPNSGR